MTANKCILIIEDERKIADLMADYLEMDGFTTIKVSSGEHAVDRILQEAPSLVLLDLMLPGMDGISICREVRKSSNVPIIIITAKVYEVDRLVGLEIGADDYICKPFSPREVVARVKAVLRRTGHSGEQRRIAVGAFVLDQDFRSVTIAGELLNLTPSEYGLMQVLMMSPGRVFSRNELLVRVQGYQFDGYDRTIDSHVKNLRKKISKIIPENDVITTIYGVGYKFNG